MKEDKLKKFREHFRGDYQDSEYDYWYKCCRKFEKLELIVEDEDYEIRFTYNPMDDYAMGFRLENFKQYFLGSKNNGPKDNDLTIIDDNIYQIELKDIKNNKGQNVPQQLFCGFKWVKNNILWVADPEEYCGLKRVYNICIDLKKIPKQTNTARPTLSRKDIIKVQKKHEGEYTTVVWWTKENFSKLSLPLNDVISKVIGSDNYHSFSDYDFIGGKDKRSIRINWNGASEVWSYDKAEECLRNNGSKLEDYVKQKVRELVKKNSSKS